MTHADLTIADLPDRQRQWYPQSVAFVTDDTTWTYEDLASRTTWCRQWLTESGIGPSDRVVTIFGQTPEFAAWYLAIAQLGAVSVPINLRLAPPEVDEILMDADPALVLVAADQVPWVAPLWQPDRDDHPLRWVVAPATEPHQGPAPSRPPVAAGDAATILYTSGTTGRAKGCVMSHRSLVTASMNLFYGMRLRPADRYLATLPMFHVGGLAFMLGFLHAGARTVVSGSADPTEMLAAIDRHGITFISVPFLSDLLDEAELRGVQPATLRMVGWGSQMERTTTLQRVGPVLGCEWRGMFGGTEAGNVALITTLDDEVAHPGTIGRPMPGLLASVRDPDTREELPPGEPGELCVRGPSVMTEYWRRPDATAETIRDGWVGTGDLVRYGAEGLLYFEGRVKDMIKSGGENVFAIEVESQLLAVDGVSDVAVFGVPDDKWGEVVCAAVVRDDSAIDAESLSAHLRQHLAGYKVPKHWFFIDEIPRILGKAVKKELRDRFAHVGEDSRQRNTE